MTVSDACAEHLCLSYADAAPVLDAPSARCAQVVGIEDTSSESGFSPLERNGSYLVRVVSERSSDLDITSQRLPAVLSSPEMNSATDVTLIPTAWNEVPLAPEPAVHNERSAELDVHCIYGFNQGRFAMIDPSGGQGGIRMLSFAETVSNFDGNDEVAEDALVFSEEETRSADAELASESGQALAILSHGSSMRILRHLHDENGESSGIKIEKISLGDASNLASGSLEEPRFHWNFSRLQFRGFEWLGAYDTTESGNPPDAYLLYFKRGFLLVERESNWHAEGASLANNFDRLGRFADYLGTSVSELTLPGFSAGLCGDLQDGGGQAQEIDESGNPLRVTRVCVNLTRLTGDEVDLGSLALLSAAEGETQPYETVHVFSDAQKDRVLVFPTDALLGQGTTSLMESMQEVSVG
jgi:hypothetical protein